VATLALSPVHFKRRKNWYIRNERLKPQENPNPTYYSQKYFIHIIKIFYKISTVFIFSSPSSVSYFHLEAYEVFPFSDQTFKSTW